MGCNAWNHESGCKCNFRGGHGGNRGSSPIQVRKLTPTQRLARSEPLGRRQFGLTPTKCPVCSRPVFFVRPYAGGAVWFDELGPPWPKHGCFNPPKPATMRTAARFVESLQTTTDLSSTSKPTFAASLVPGSVVRDRDLSRLDLTGLDLSGIIFLNVSLVGASLVKCNLSDTSLLQCDLTGSVLRGARLVDADLRRAVLNGADLRAADLTNADMQAASLVGAQFDGQTVLVASNLTSADCTGAHCKTRLGSPEPTARTRTLPDMPPAWVVANSKQSRVDKAHYPHPRKAARALCGTPFSTDSRAVSYAQSDVSPCAACLRLISRQ